MAQIKVFIGEVLSVDRLPVFPVFRYNIASLNQLVLHDPVDSAALVVQGHPVISRASLPSAELRKVFDSLGHHVAKQPDHNSLGLSLLSDLEMMKHNKKEAKDSKPNTPIVIVDSGLL